MPTCGYPMIPILAGNFEEYSLLTVKKMCTTWKNNSFSQTLMFTAH